jgi:hypothetical protein
MKLRRMVLEYKVEEARNFIDLDCIYNPRIVNSKMGSS